AYLMAKRRAVEAAAVEHQVIVVIEHEIGIERVVLDFLGVVAKIVAAMELQQHEIRAIGLDAMAEHQDFASLTVARYAEIQHLDALAGSRAPRSIEII